MHMADALVSPSVGGAMWAVTGGLIAYSARKLNAEMDDRKPPLMGVLGAFIFSAQMINFSIPGTGSSGHLGGGMILAILLGPHAAFLTITSVVAVQALFFADGGLLTLGCNIFNLGFFPCFIAYPFIYKKIVAQHTTQGYILIASMISAIVGLQLGSLSVVIETVCSGISELPFTAFAVLMQPIHLAIGLVEGLITAAVVGTIWKARPEMMDTTAAAQPNSTLSGGKIIAGLMLLTILTAGVFSWFASVHPDGLEWSMHHVSGKEELTEGTSPLHTAMNSVQEKTSILPEYEFKKSSSPQELVKVPEDPSSVVNLGTSVAGLLGAALTLIIVVLIGAVLRMHGSAKQSQRGTSDADY